jgi:hypothetical protein
VPEVILKGAERMYRVDCSSDAALERIEEVSGFPLLEVCAALNQPDPDPCVAELFLTAILLDGVPPEEIPAVLEDIGGLPVLRAAAEAIRGSA